MEEQHHQNQYAIIPADVLYDRDLAMADKILYGVISNLCNQKGYCWATNAYLGEVMGLKKDTISKSISRLREHGYLIDFYESRGGRQERRLKTYAHFRIPGFVKSPDQVVPKSEEQSTSPETHLYESKTESKTEKPAQPVQAALDIWPTFEQFWELGLPKMDKERAKKYWSKLSQKEKEVIMEYVPKYVDSTSDRKYLKQAATFLNQKAWTNEIIDRRTATNIAKQGDAIGNTGITVSGTVARVSQYTD